jgi:hypothetical protein
MAVELARRGFQQGAAGIVEGVEWARYGKAYIRVAVGKEDWHVGLRDIGRVHQQTGDIVNQQRLNWFYGVLAHRKPKTFELTDDLFHRR